jgi:hypothetical protein
MVTGIETAGVVLATLPLCVEAAKAYARGVDTFCDFALHSRRDEALADFYDEFYWHVAELDQHVRHISKIATAGTSQPSSLLTLKQWHETPQLEDALIRGLGNEDSYHQYIITTEKIALLLGLLLKHKTLYIKKADVVSQRLSRVEHKLTIIERKSHVQTPKRLCAQPRLRQDEEQLHRAISIFHH